jgi:hypothetical protein
MTGPRHEAESYSVGPFTRTHGRTSARKNGCAAFHPSLRDSPEIKVRPGAHSAASINRSPHPSDGFHMRATTRRAVDLRGIHQASHGGQAKSQCAAGAESIAKAGFHNRPTRCSFLPRMHGGPHSEAPRRTHVGGAIAWAITQTNAGRLIGALRVSHEAVA